MFLKQSRSKWWKSWANALGSKAFPDKKNADRVAFIRTLIILQAVITNILICINIIRKW